MPTLGDTGAPTDGWEAWSGGSYNQFAVDYTAPDDIIITDIGVWLRGYVTDCGFRGVVWNSTRNTVLGKTASQTATGASGSAGASNLYEAPVVTEFEVASGDTIYVGFTRNTSGAMQMAYNTGEGAHYEDNNSSSTPSGMSGENLHADRNPHFYVRYELARPEFFVRRSGAWADPTDTVVRRSGVWTSIGPEGYVYRSGVWVKA